MIVPDDAVTVPVPAPLLVTVRAYVGVALKVAVTLLADVPIGTVQVPVPGQLMPAPVQPAKVEAGEDGVAVNMTLDPLSKEAEQAMPQLIPAGALVTVPELPPLRVSATLTAYLAGIKLAVTEVAALKVTTQVLVPEQPPPLQPAKTDVPAVGVAVNVTTVPW